MTAWTRFLGMFVKTTLPVELPNDADPAVLVAKLNEVASDMARRPMAYLEDAERLALRVLEQHGVAVAVEGQRLRPLEPLADDAHHDCHLAADVLEECWTARCYARSPETAHAMLAGADLGEAVMMLRTSVHVGQDVVARRRQKQNLRRAEKSVTDEQIRAALGAHPTFEDAAAALGISAKQIQRRIPADEREAIRAAKGRTPDRTSS